MGLTCEYIAIPNDLELLNQAYHNKLDGYILENLRFYLSARRGNYVDRFLTDEDKDIILVVETVKKMIIDCPGIEYRYREYDYKEIVALELLLRHYSKDGDDEFVDSFVKGEKDISPDFMIRYTPPDTCELIELWLSEIRKSHLKVKYTELANHKYHHDFFKHYPFGDIKSNYKSLLKLYQSVNHFSEGILVITY